MWSYRGTHASVIETPSRYVEVARWLVKKNNSPRFLGRVIAHLIHRYPKKFTNNSYQVSLMPGFECNLSCSYCYQWDSQGGNKPKIKEKISSELLVDYLSDWLVKSNKKSLHITFLGGEPLLYDRQILEITEEAHKRKIELTFGLVSNGTLISRIPLDKYIDLGLKSFQISIDGGKEGQEVYRKYKSGKNSFDDVISGLERLISFEIPVNLRVNTTAENIISGVNLPKYLAEKINKKDRDLITFSFAPVDDVESWSRPEMRSWKDFLYLYSKCYSQATKYGFLSQLPGHSGKCPVCNPSKGNEGQDGIVITSSGELYSCWDTAGQPGYGVGSLKDGFAEDISSHRWKQCGYASSWSLIERTELEQASIKGRLSPLDYEK